MRYIGCKTLLLENIKDLIMKKAPEAKRVCDIFSGTATVGRYLKQWFEVYSNDILYFSYCLQRGTIECDTKPEFINLKKKYNISDPIKYLNNIETRDMNIIKECSKFFLNNYSPKGGRMYINEENALRIDYCRYYIEMWNDEGLLTSDEYYYLLASLIEGIPFVSNISGTYGAFHKEWDKRTYKKFQLIELDIVSNKKVNKCFNEDGLKLLNKIEGDVLYIDPPYNERQYLPNYHVLETAARMDFPVLKGITGQREYLEDQKSDFCIKRNVYKAFDNLVRSANFKHIILSYNTDGIMDLTMIEEIMKKYGKPETFEINFIDYRRYKSRKENARKDALKEMLIYIEKE